MSAPAPMRDAWIDPIIALIRTERDERLAISAALVALAGDDHDESRQRLDKAIAAIRDAWDELGEKDGRRKRSKTQQIAARTLGMLETARADLAQVMALADG